MSDATNQPAPESPTVPPTTPPEPLELRTRPRRVTRINRRVLIAVAGIGMALLAGLILVALDPPSWRKTGVGPELITVDRKATPDGLGRLPSSYDGVSGERADRQCLEDRLGAGRSGAERARSRQRARAGREGPPRTARGPGAGIRRRCFACSRRAPRPSRSAVHPVHRRLPSARTDVDQATTAAATAAARLRAQIDGTTPGTDATDQTRKLAFLKAGPEKEIYNPHVLQKPVSPYQLMAGTIIAASLVTGLNADLPGFVIAQVTEHVYDSVSGRFLLIPQGSRLVGRYDSVVAHGQQRALLVWQRIIRPDGSSLQIDNLPATDTAGYAGLQDGVDLHTWQLLKGIGLATVLGVGSSLAFGSGSGDSDIIRALRELTGQTTNRAGQRLIERELNVQPTLTVRPGWPLRVIVHKDLILSPYRD